jgi:hypothetical protein
MDLSPVVGNSFTAVAAEWELGDKLPKDRLR